MLIWQTQAFYGDLPVLMDLQLENISQTQEQICLQNEEIRTTNQLWNSPDFGNLSYISLTAFLLVQFLSASSPHFLVHSWVEKDVTGIPLLEYLRSFRKWNCFTAIKKRKIIALIFLKEEQKEVAFYMKFWNVWKPHGFTTPFSNHLYNHVLRREILVTHKWG